MNAPIQKLDVTYECPLPIWATWNDDSSYSLRIIIRKILMWDVVSVYQHFYCKLFFIYLVVCKLFANRCTILRGVFTIFRLIKKTGQDNSYMHLSGANFWHLIFRPNFKVVDIINDVFRDGRNTRISLLQIRWGQFWPNNSPLPLLQRLHFWSSLSPPGL